MLSYVVLTASKRLGLFEVATEHECDGHLAKEIYEEEDAAFPVLVTRMDMHQEGLGGKSSVRIELLCHSRMYHA